MSRIRRYRDKRAARRLLDVYMAEISARGDFVKTKDELLVECWLFHVMGYDKTAKLMLSTVGMALPSWFGLAAAVEEARGRESAALEAIQRART